MTQSVTLPDGSIHNFPDEATPEMIAGALGVSAPPSAQPANPQVGTGMDVAKSVGSNLVGGGIDLAMTLPNLVNQTVAGPQLLGRGIAENVDKLIGIEPQPRGELWQPLYSSYDAEKVLGTDYQPQTTAGQVAALPARILGGIGAAKGLQKAEIGAEKLLNDQTSGIPQNPQTTAADISKLSQQQYALADQKGGVLKPDVTNRFINEVDSMARQTPQGKALAGNSEFTKTSDILKGFKDQPVSLRAAQEIDEELADRIDSFVDRQTGILDKQGKKLLDIQTKFRETIDSASPSDVIGGKDGFEALKEGRRLWSASARLRDIERIINRAEMTDNPATAIKTGFRTLASNPARLRGFSKQEVTLIKNAAKTGIIGDSLRTMGSRLIPAITAASGGGLGATAAAQATTMASRNAATRMQVNRATKVANAVANRAMTPPSTQQVQNFPSFLLPLETSLLESKANRLALPLEDMRQKLNR
jgi:hypothetical protein